MPTPLFATGMLAVILGALLSGFFYAWICSTMWGLDAMDPRQAIAAMQAMNASVRNAVFAPVFVGTAPVMALDALLAYRTGTAILALLLGHKPAALVFGAAGLLCLFGIIVLTFSINVPMNEALALVEIPQERDAADAIWVAYSQPWQVWNQTRTVAALLGLVLAVLGLRAIS